MCYPEEPVVGYVFARRCVICDRYFTGIKSNQAAKRHMREVHGKRMLPGWERDGNSAAYGNVRAHRINVIQKTSGDLALAGFSGIIEVHNEDE